MSLINCEYMNWILEPVGALPFIVTVGLFVLGRWLWFLVKLAFYVIGSRVLLYRPVVYLAVRLWIYTSWDIGDSVFSLFDETWRVRRIMGNDKLATFQSRIGDGIRYNSTIHTDRANHDKLDGYLRGWHRREIYHYLFSQEIEGIIRERIKRITTQ